jgi:hypothetical protein
MESCYFLDKLPLELRFRIYEFHLTYQYPIKEYIAPGTKDLPLLRLNRQIHQEALQVLYDRNRVVVKTSYFCKNTTTSMKSPVKAEWVRHLLIANFVPSIACAFQDLGMMCDFCQASPAALVLELKALPRLRTVIVDYRGHSRDVERFKAAVRGSEDFELVPLKGDSDPFAYKLEGSGLGELLVECRWGMPDGPDRALLLR